MSTRLIPLFVGIPGNSFRGEVPVGKIAPIAQFVAQCIAEEEALKPPPLCEEQKQIARLTAANSILKAKIRTLTSEKLSQIEPRTPLT